MELQNPSNDNEEKNRSFCLWNRAWNSIHLRKNFVESPHLSNIMPNDLERRSSPYSPIYLQDTPSVLTFSNITVITNSKENKILLNNVSGKITGGFWAVQGASGSGKTTLLSTLSLRLDSKAFKISGEFRINGRHYSRNDLKAMSAYVLQDDLLHSELTVNETLAFSAELRMDSKTTHEMRNQRVEEVIKMLDLEKCKHVMIGNSQKKGISGGERKRVSVGIELLNRPKLIFMDEPTTGLDSSTAFSVCKILKRLTERNDCTIVCTIHQPQPKTFLLFDNLILMKKGEIVYLGQLLKVVLFLDNIGKPCPCDVDLSDHLLDIVSPNTDPSTSKIIEDHSMATKIPIKLDLGIEKPFYHQDPTSSWILEFLILLQRNLLIYFRSYNLILLNLLASILISIFISLGFWNNIGTSQSATSAVLPSLFFLMVNQGVTGSLQAVTSFPAERAIMLRERASGSYQVSSYFMAKFVCDILTLLWQPFLVSIFVYFNIGYQPKVSKFFIFMFFLMLDALAATSLATLVVCTCVSIERSTVVLSFLFEISRLYGGYYTSPKMLHEQQEWKFADALSYIKYAYVGSALNQLQGSNFDCSKSEPCIITSGEQLIDLNGYDEYTIQSCFGYLIVLIIGFRFLAYFGLRFIK